MAEKLERTETVGVFRFGRSSRLIWKDARGRQHQEAVDNSEEALSRRAQHAAAVARAQATQEAARLRAAQRRPEIDRRLQAILDEGMAAFRGQAA